MMVISIDLGIPLFIVGKPGSSKSLAKTVVCDVMQGPNSYAEFYKNFKEVHMVSFQCSPLATSGSVSHSKNNLLIIIFHLKQRGSLAHSGCVRNIKTRKISTN